MILLVSNNIRHIRRVYGRKVDVALSVESALNRLSRRNYKKIVCDIRNANAIREYEEQIPIVSYRDYIRSLNRPKQNLYKQQVISFWSTKGGVGKTTLILDLIDTIPKGIKTLIIDFNVADGGSDMSFMLSIPPVPHLGTYLNSRKLQDNVINVAQNVDILQAPPGWKFVKDVSEDNIIELLAQARANYDLVLFDLPNSDSKMIAKVAQYSSKVFMVTKGTPGELKRILEKDIDCTLIVTCSKGYDKQILKYLKIPWITIPTEKEVVKIYEYIYK